MWIVGFAPAPVYLISIACVPLIALLAYRLIVWLVQYQLPAVVRSIVTLAVVAGPVAYTMEKSVASSLTKLR